METPNEVMIHNQVMGLKGTSGTLMQISEGGYYEVNLQFGANTHRVLLPIAATVLISKDHEADLGPMLDVER